MCIANNACSVERVVEGGQWWSDVKAVVNAVIGVFGGSDSNGDVVDKVGRWVAAVSGCLVDGIECL